MIFSFEFGVPFLFLLLLFCLHHVTSMVMSGPHRLRSRAIYRGLSDTFCGRKLVCRQTTLLFEFHMMGWHFVENWVWSQQSCREKFGEKMWRDGRALSKKNSKSVTCFLVLEETVRLWCTCITVIGPRDELAFAFLYTYFRLVIALKLDFDDLHRL